MLANSFDTAALNVRESIDRSINVSARNGRLNCMMKFYSNSLKAAISGIVPSVYCRYRLTKSMLQ